VARGALGVKEKNTDQKRSTEDKNRKGKIAETVALSERVSNLRKGKRQRTAVKKHQESRKKKQTEKKREDDHGAA